METEILEEEKHSLKLKFSETDLGLLNAIKEALWKQTGVELASFRVDHPEISKPVFILKTKGKEAKKVWNAAVESLSEELEKFGSELKKLK